MTAAILLVASGVTHVSQLAVYGSETVVVAAAVFGAAYFCIGLALLLKWEAAFWFGAILPSVGAVLGVYRFVWWDANPFSVFHVAVDGIVVPICAYVLVSARRDAPRE